MVILRVELEVLRQVTDAIRQERNLYLGRSRVAGRTLVRLQDRLLALLDDCHFLSVFSFSRVIARV
jgi:hypothetical protein